MHDDLHQLATFNSAAEASIAKARLYEAGIDARLDGEAMASWFWHFGTALGGVRLYVREAERLAAEEILSEMRHEVISATEVSEQNEESLKSVVTIWNCLECESEIDSDFDVCWNCGTSREGIIDPEFNVECTPIVEDREDNPPPPWLAMLLALCPPLSLLYIFSRFSVVGSVSPVWETADQSEDWKIVRNSEQEFSRERNYKDHTELSESFRLIQRAWRASLIGIVVLPPLLCVYSTWILLKNRLLAINKNNVAFGRAWSAMLVNLIVFVIFAFILHALFRPTSLSSPTTENDPTIPSFQELQETYRNGLQKTDTKPKPLDVREKIKIPILP